jgi:hypothetical protein
MRLCTGDPAVDALTPQEVGKAGKYFLIIAGVIVLHLVVSNLFLRVRMRVGCCQPCSRRSILRYRPNNSRFLHAFGTGGLVC